MNLTETNSPAVVIDSDTDFAPYVSVQNGFDGEFDINAIPEALQFDADETPTPDAGDVIDNAIRYEIPANSAPPAPVPAAEKEESLTTGFGRRRRKNPAKPKGTAPDVDEWLDFFSRIVIRFATEWYVDYMFRGIDEDSITDADLSRLALTEDERDVIARPYAEFANKNPFMRKHGRQIVAFSDSLESTVILGRFYLRVNRIARKYRPQERKSQRPNVRLHPERTDNVDFGQGAQSQTAAGPIPEGYPVFNPGGS